MPRIFYVTETMTIRLKDSCLHYKTCFSQDIFEIVLFSFN